MKRTRIHDWDTFPVLVNKSLLVIQRVGIIKIIPGPELGFGNIITEHLLRDRALLVKRHVNLVQRPGYRGDTIFQRVIPHPVFSFQPSVQPGDRIDIHVIHVIIHGIRRDALFLRHRKPSFPIPVFIVTAHACHLVVRVLNLQRVITPVIIMPGNLAHAHGVNRTYTHLHVIIIVIITSHPTHCQ